MAGVQKALMKSYDSYITGVAKIGAKLLGVVQNSTKLSPIMKALFGKIITGAAGAAMALGTVVAAAAAVVVAVVGIAIAIAAIAAVLALVGVAIFLWAKKFTDTLNKSLSVTSAYRGKVLELKTAFDTLKGSMMSLGTTILTAIAPAIMTVVNWLVKAINYASMFIAALSGQKSVMQYVSGSTEAAANSAGDLADNTAKAGKAAKGALAAFDQLNVLQMEEPKQPSGGGAGGNIVLQAVDIDPKILETVEKIKKAFSDAWTWVKTAATDAWAWTVGIWATFSEWFRTSVWVPISTWFMNNVFGPLYMKFQELKMYFVEFWTSVMQPAIDWIVKNVWPVFQWFGKVLGTLFMVTVPATFQFLWGVIKSVFTWIVDLFKNVWITITGVVKGIMTSLEGIIQFLTGVFTGNWALAWEGIKRIFKGVWESIVALSKGFVNLIIDTVNFMIRAVVAGVNAVIGAFNKISVKIPEWVPTYGGSTFGLSIPSVTAPQIPRLATGAVIPPNSQFLAVLGDQKHGTNIESPVGLMAETFERVLSQQGSQKITVDFGNSTLGALIRTLNPVIKQETDRMGSSLLNGAS